MPSSDFTENDFLQRITRILEDNLSDERFGVSELAVEANMSRSNLLRKIKKATKISASQFINQVRLKKAMELLGSSSLTVSEVAYNVGFGSPSYFIKCFRDYYGYPPGEVGKRSEEMTGEQSTTQSDRIHQLAAIMFTDIQGYTALMQHDEQKAIEYRTRHREVFDTTTKKYNGRILQYYGDGTLSTFSSAIDAVRCAIEMQLAFREEPQIPVRVGIHTGDIVVSKDEIIGDGVNIASRIESLAFAGSVFISEKVFDEVKNQVGIQTASMGIFELKNVDKPMEVFAITNPGLVHPEGDKLPGRIDSGMASKEERQRGGRIKTVALWVVIALAIVSLGYILYLTGVFRTDKSLIASQEIPSSKKSIAVLPFINDSNDSTNVYIINGLMESILNHLQKINNLRVISRTSVEKYRLNPKSVPEIARELNVNYLVEGSGQKVGDQIMLNIQLIEASRDEHIWGEQYNREARDIFALQMEVAKSIADEIQVIITPEEEKRIEKIPTESLVAYDYYLKGLDLFTLEARGNVPQAIVWFKKAVEEDPEFALGYANIALAYFFLDFEQTEKQYADVINEYADKALLYDPQLAQSLIAKAVYYLENRDFDSALPHLEKALEYNPNSALVINILSDFYNRWVPNTAKYLEYALKGIRLDPASNDSLTTSFIYMHVSNALIQTGFTDEALKYINKSLNYFPENTFSGYVKAFIMYAKNRDLAQTRDMLLEVLSQDTTRYDVLQETGKIFYFMRDYQGAYKFYKRFIDYKESMGMNIYPTENLKIGYVLSKMGFEEKAKQYVKSFKEYADSDQTIYKDVNLAMYYSYTGEIDKAIEHLRLFSEQDNYHYWMLILFKADPVVEQLMKHPKFDKIFNKIEKKFWDNHDRIQDLLVKEELIEMS